MWASTGWFRTMSTTCRDDLRPQPTAGMTTRSGTMPRSVSGAVARRRPCPVRTEASVPATVTSNGGTEVATSSRRAFAAARTSRTALSPESNRSGTASTVIIMSETVLFSADPPPPHAPVYRLALVANPAKGSFMSVDRGLLVILEAQPGKEDELAAFLTQAQSLAAGGLATAPWTAVMRG